MGGSLDAFAVAKLAALEADAVRRRLVTSARDGVFITRGGRRLISFSCNDYLNLSQNEEVIEAAVAATRRYGTGAGASRLVTGNHPLFEELEAALADYKRTAGAIVFGAGYLANAGIVPVLAGAEDLLLVDELAHACLWAGANLSGARLCRFRHNDVGHAAAVLAAHRGEHRHALILTDRVFSMDGDLAPMAALAALAARHDAWLMADDAHGLGVLPPDEHAALRMGTLSKAIGAAGGYLCASAPVIELMRNRARSFVYSTGLPPGTVAAAIAALAIIRREPAYGARPLALARRFTAALGLPAAHSPIVPLIVGEAAAALAASSMLEAEGFLVAAIRPPTVPAGTARLRFTFTAQHTEADVDRLAALVAERLGAGERVLAVAGERQHE
jgi:8-amino-7-oxononanoate synthase